MASSRSSVFGLLLAGFAAGAFFPSVTQQLTGFLTAAVTSTTYSVSPYAGQIVINEVSYAQSSTASAANNDEFIELYNAGTSPIDLQGWGLLDTDAISFLPPLAPPSSGEGGTGTISGTTQPFDFDTACGSYAVCSGSTVLAPGKYAVIWVGNPGVLQSTTSTEVTFQAWMGKAPKLNNGNDDLWLYDPSDAVVGIVSWGSGTSLSPIPGALSSLWNTSNNASLTGASAGTSISLATNGATPANPNCWELTLSADADGLCPGYIPTRTTTAPLVESPGANNHNPEDLPVVPDPVTPPTPLDPPHGSVPSMQNNPEKYNGYTSVLEAASYANCSEEELGMKIAAMSVQDYLQMKGIATSAYRQISVSPLSGTLEAVTGILCPAPLVADARPPVLFRGFTDRTGTRNIALTRDSDARAQLATSRSDFLSSASKTPSVVEVLDGRRSFVGSILTRDGYQPRSMPMTLEQLKARYQYLQPIDAADASTVGRIRAAR
ncbi:lamin tail domain-containing protein [Candidatus Peribacteria bacterium]|nr:lamin tail domain-containing protein [Candidatus Peribacteria bacterium]